MLDSMCRLFQVGCFIGRFLPNGNDRLVCSASRWICTGDFGWWIVDAVFWDVVCEGLAIA